MVRPRSFSCRLFGSETACGGCRVPSHKATALARSSKSRKRSECSPAPRVNESLQESRVGTCSLSENRLAPRGIKNLRLQVSRPMIPSETSIEMDEPIRRILHRNDERIILPESGPGKYLSKRESIPRGVLLFSYALGHKLQSTRRADYSGKLFRSLLHHVSESVRRSLATSVAVKSSAPTFGKFLRGFRSTLAPMLRKKS